MWVWQFQYRMCKWINDMQTFLGDSNIYFMDIIDTTKLFFTFCFVLFFSIK